MDDQVLDLRGLKCPLPVLKTRRAMRGLARGARLWVETTDPVSAIDLPNYCREDGHELVEIVADEGCHRFLIEHG
ncbi:MAG: sulfurtransferase TusA family protein [Salaquimonas sp.]|nr:sulfurtransferase TusA family protein [Salaquimonas sp.]